MRGLRIEMILVPIPNMPIAPHTNNKAIQLVIVNIGATFRKFENFEREEDKS